MEAHDIRKSDDIVWSTQQCVAVNNGQDLANLAEQNGQYGAFPPRIAITCGVSQEKAQEIFDAYWEVNWSIKQVAEDQKVKEVNGQLWLLNPVNGFYYFLKNRKDIFSTLVQGTASYVFDFWVGLVLQKTESIVGQFHDEFILDLPQGYREGVIQFIYECNEELNLRLKLNRRLDIDVQIGTRYSEIH